MTTLELLKQLEWGGVVKTISRYSTEIKKVEFCISCRCNFPNHDPDCEVKKTIEREEYALENLRQQENDEKTLY